ncbi:vWA domain-containing protein [Hydrogenovibrio thermophilus]|nr:VWA domain-containing protein [Hydrogenovibrio thermophilus]
MDAWLQWEWRDATTLWFLLAPLVWGLVSTWLRRRQTAQYAESHLLPWVKVTPEALLAEAAQVEQTTQRRKLARPGRFVRGLWRFVAGLFQPKWLLSLAWMCLIIALAGPRTLVPSPQESTRAGVDILVALDTSRSMLVQDVAPNRFLQARALVESLANRLEPDDRLGLMVFAGRPHLVAPLSFDRALFEHYLNLVRPGILPTRGSDEEAAVAFGLEHLQQTAGPAKVLLMFTNGQPAPESLEAVSERLKAAVASVKESQTQVVLVGVGRETPSPIPSMNHPSGTVYVHGRQVRSQLESAELSKLAAQLGGDYVTANRSGDFLEQLLNLVAQQAEKRTFQASQPVWQDHAEGFLWAAFFALLWSFFPVKRRFVDQRFSAKSSSKANLTVGLAVVGVALMSGLQPKPVWADTQVGTAQKAYEAFQSQDYDTAQETYNELSTYQGLFGAGAAAYRNKDFESSVAYFRDAAVLGLTDSERAQALFNLGNSYYQAGLLPQAIEAYEQALVYQSDYDKAKHNLALAKRQRQRQSGQQQNEEQGDGQGEGTTSRDADGAFYGGQRPNPDEVGEGASGDAPEGEKDGREFILPDQPEGTDFSLESGSQMQLNDTANAILDQQQRVRRIEQFEHDMQKVDDNQSLLLKNLFEREEGFQASQDEPHPLPGVKPW